MKSSSVYRSNEKILCNTNHHKTLTGVGTQGNDRAAKRAHSGLPEKIAKSKRTKNEKEESIDRIPSQLLQHLISMPRPRAKGREEGIWLADGGGGSESESPPHKSLQSHSVLMNLLVSGCDVSHGYICIGSSRSRNPKRQKT